MVDNTPFIWKWFKTNTKLPDEAIAGVMGNMEAESNCESLRVQGDFSEWRTRSKAYADAVDDGSKAETFRSDALGWGLCQWTYYTRKMELLSFCRARSKSIGDLQTQLEFFVYEMQKEYGSLWNALLSCHDIEAAARMVVEQYERPAVLNTTARANYGKGFYAEFHSADLSDVRIADDADETDSIKKQLLELLDQLATLVGKL